MKNVIQGSTVLMALLLAGACARGPSYDLVIRHGTLYDGTGAVGVIADIAIQGDSIVSVGDLGRARGRDEIDATGLVVAPGFINMLSHSEESLIEDPRSQSDIRQGVTLEVFGEGSMGPLTETMRKEWLERHWDIRYDITWTTLGGYFDFLEKRGITPNVASFVGAPTVREHELRQVNRPPTVAELDRMKRLVQQAMEEGAMGLRRPSSIPRRPSPRPTSYRTGQSCGAVWRDLHRTHAERRRSSPGGDRRNHPDCARGQHSGRDLSSQGRGAVQLA